MTRRRVSTGSTSKLSTTTDGTLPSTLTLEQVRVQTNAQLQLLDAVISDQSSVISDHRALITEHCSPSLRLLAEVAILALEGCPRPAGTPPLPVRAPVPGHAGRILQRLLGVREPYSAVLELQADLEATRHEPAQVTTPAENFSSYPVLRSCG